MIQHAVLELERFLPYRLSVLSNRISQMIAREYEKRFQLSVTDWRIMAILAQQQDLSANQVAERAAMDKVAVSRAVAKLVQTQRIKRTMSSVDKRRSILRLTTEGWKIYRQVAPLALAYEQRLLSLLSNEESVSLEKILRKLDSIGNHEVTLLVDRFS